MAPIKLDDNIREKLEERELKPSANAWEKLESQLEVKQPKNRKVFWYFAAASLAGILIVSSVFINRNTIPSGNELLVDENIPQQIEPKKLNQIISAPINSEALAQEESTNEKTSSEEKKKNTKKELKPVPSQKKSTIEKQKEHTEAIAQVTSMETQTIVEKTETPALSDEEQLFNTKIEEVVAQVQQLQDNNQEVTSDEIDALLNNARQEIQTQRIINSSKVDAMALLNDVEWELEESFRDKVFDALGDGYKKIRTAVIERNE